ncbi:MAG: EAL domain-containing protein [Desulfosporosinus sp.]|nr:EAL domain-containing protein [Desulfosporosinus sp.]
MQPEIVRSFILMSYLNEPSISKWVAKLKADSLLALMIGVAHDEVPEVGNHYGLMNRLWLANPDSPDQDSLHTFRRLKIDQFFVRDIRADANGEAVITTIILLAQNLGLKVIAEGVETKTQWSFFKDRRCDEMQGYFFSKPFLAKDVEKEFSCLIPKIYQTPPHLGQFLIASV